MVFTRATRNTSAIILKDSVGKPRITVKQSILRMNLKLLRRLMATAAIFAMCSSCATHEVAFNEADFTGVLKPGSGTVKGQAFRTLKDDSFHVVNHRGIVRLMPVNAYTDEIVKKKYADARRMVKADPRFRRYVRKTHPDHNGNFTFQNVPPGDYYVSCHALWTYPETEYDADNNPMETEVQDGQWLYVTVSVKNGQTVVIDSWNQGR
jgi:hypothetical protein